MEIALGLVAVLMESSAWSWPFVLWWSWWLMRDKEGEKKVWMVILMGVVLDVLVVRTVGVGALGLWVFVMGLVGTKVFFSGDARIEKIWLLAASMVWAYWWGGLRLWGVLVVGVVTMLIGLWEGRVVKGGIRLK